LESSRVYRESGRLPGRTKWEESVGNAAAKKWGEWFHKENQWGPWGAQTKARCLWEKKEKEGESWIGQGGSVFWSKSAEYGEK